MSIHQTSTVSISIHLESQTIAPPLAPLSAPGHGAPLAMASVVRKALTRQALRGRGRRFSSDLIPRGPEEGGLVLYDSLSATYRRIPLSVSPGPEGAEAGAGRPLGLMWYTCGPTVYDSAHLGHARTYVALDLVRRALLEAHRSLPPPPPPPPHSPQQPQQQPPPPLFVMNITDVDDKILARAAEMGEGTDPIALARRYEAEFWADLDGLNVLRPDVVTRVTEHVEGAIVPYIGRMVDGGMAYVLKDDNEGDGGGGSSSVYFDVAAFEAAGGGGVNRYGKLAPPIAAAEAPEGGDFFLWEGGEGGGGRRRRTRRKRDPRDFVLWKGRGEGEEALSWPSPFGPGRPGWHIECSAMIEAVSRTFAGTHRMQVHAGGIDLKFPHHTNEIAQAEAYRSSCSSIAAEVASSDSEGGGEEWIPHWVHTGHLHIRGMKMSKSLKNFVTIRDLLSKDGAGLGSSSSLASPSDDFRLWCLGLCGSYRGPATYSEARIEEAGRVREKIVRFLVTAEDWIERSCSSPSGEGRLPSGVWGRSDVELLEAAAACTTRCRQALMGSIDGGGGTGGGFDLNGAEYLRAMVDLAEAGSAHVSSPNDGVRPVEPVRNTVSALRHQLSVVGFTDATVRAGARDCVNEGSAANVKGGEREIIEQFVDFRSKVRAAGLNAAKAEDAGPRKETWKELLSLCDAVRDEHLPPIGVEILDASESSERGESDGSRWRFCVPKSGAELDRPLSGGKGKDSTAVPKANTSGKISAEEYFKVGTYKDKFSRHNEDGMPTHNADGTDVSKRLLKKLTKKRSKYLRTKTPNK